MTTATNYVISFYTDGDNPPISGDKISPDKIGKYSSFCEISRSPMYLSATNRRGERLVVDNKRMSPEKLAEELWRLTRDTL